MTNKERITVWADNPPNSEESSVAGQHTELEVSCESGIGAGFCRPPLFTLDSSRKDHDEEG